MLVSLIRNASTACLSLFFLLLAPWALAGDLWVDFIDVGQGDSALILSPSGKSVLVDGGPADAADEILEVMRARNIKRLDLIVISHAHADHIGGLEAIMGKVDVGLVLDPGFPHPTETYRRLLQHIEAKKIPLAIARKGRQIDLGEGSRMLLIAPKDPLLSGTRSDANSNSVVLRLEMGNVSVLLTGDAEAPTERRIMEYPDELAATILKVGHHGSRHSTTEAFLELVAPRVGIISCGRDNRYQHPHPELLSRLASQPMAVYRTDLHGTITLRTDGKKWAIGTEHHVAWSAANHTGAQASRSMLEAGVVDSDDENDTLINVNQASNEELESLPGIGPVKAKAIVLYRTQQGPFETIDALLHVRGIGLKTLEKIKPLLTTRNVDTMTAPRPHTDKAEAPN